MSIQAFLTTGVRPHIAVPTPSDRVSSAEVHGDELNHSQRPSTQEQSARTLASRFDSLNIRLRDVSVVARALSILPVTGSADVEAEVVSGRDYFNARLGESSKVQYAMQGLLEKIEVSKVSEHLLERELLSAHHLASATEARNLERSFADDTFKLLRGLPDTPRNVQNFLGQPKASGDFFETLQGTINFIKEDYLAIYEQALTNYSNFYKEFNEKIMANMGKWITGSSDGKSVDIHPTLYHEIEKLILKYNQGGGSGALFTPPGNKPMPALTLQSWANTLGGGAYVHNSSVHMQESALDSMLNALPKPSSSNPQPIKMEVSKFQAWQSGFNSQESALKNNLQLLTTKYANANSYHENFNKILSSQLSQYSEMLKAMANTIA